MKPNDGATSSSPRPFGSYEDIAVELERIAEMVQQRPELNHHAADRLLQIARDIRLDASRSGTQDAGSVLR
jgi:hypothetical protein